MDDKGQHHLMLLAKHTKKRDQLIGKIKEHTEVRGGFSVVFGAPAPGRPNGFQLVIFSALRNKTEMNN